MFGKNIKVHFAGVEDKGNGLFPLQVADCHYSLYSCYRSILRKTPDSDFRLPENSPILVQCRDMRHVIQDSGLFTLMFGAKKQEKQTIQTLTVWQDKLMEFVKQNNITASIVEIDCQKILGVEEAWYFRERMRKLLPHSTQVNVFHFEDGIKGLDRLIEFSDYIAVSVPEWRIVKESTHKKEIRYITHYIKNKKPEIDIHLLGCTDMKIIEQNRFCSTCDSTTWLTAVRYGHLPDGFLDGKIANLKTDIYEQRRQEIVERMRESGCTDMDNRIDYITKASLAATILKQQYEKAAGAQD